MTEKLKDDLKKVLPCTCIPAYKDRGLSAPDCAWCNYSDDVIDLILADRKRICEPLVKLKDTYKGYEYDWVHKVPYSRHIDETLRRAGL